MFTLKTIVSSETVNLVSAKRIHNLISKDHRFLRVVLRHVCGNRFLKSCEERRGQHLLNAFLRLCCEVFVAIDFGNPVGSGVANTFGMHFPVCVAKYLLQSVSEILWERRGQHLRNLFPRLCCELCVAIDFGNPVGSGVANTIGMHFPACVANCLLPSYSEIMWGAAWPTPSE